VRDLSHDLEFVVAHRAAHRMGALPVESHVVTVSDRPRRLALRTAKAGVVVSLPLIGGQIVTTRANLFSCLRSLDRASEAEDVSAAAGAVQFDDSHDGVCLSGLREPHSSAALKVGVA